MAGWLGVIEAGTDPSSVLNQLRKVLVSIGHWWLREFRASVPRRLLAVLDVNRTAVLVVQPLDDQVTATLMDRSGRAVFAKASPWPGYLPEHLGQWIAEASSCEPSLELMLRLPDADAIQGKLTLPSEAEAKIEEIVREQIVRKTPFDLNSVHLGYATVAIDAKRLEVRYLLVPKQRLDRHLGQLGLSPGAVASIVCSEHDIWHAPRIRMSTAPRRILNPSNQLIAALLTALLGSLAYELAATLWQQQTILQDIERRSEAIAGPAKSIVGRLNDIRDVNEQVADLVAVRGSPRLVDIWEELANLLPSSTYLTTVDVRGQQLQLSGVSVAAGDLIPILERSPMFSGVELSGPTTTDRARGREQFSLKARLRKHRLLSDDES